jgi:hypothetical protein
MPLDDDIIHCLTFAPKLLERLQIVSRIKQKISDFVEIFINGIVALNALKQGESIIPVGFSQRTKYQSNSPLSDTPIAKNGLPFLSGRHSLLVVAGKPLAIRAGRFVKPQAVQLNGFRQPFFNAFGKVDQQIFARWLIRNYVQAFAHLR